MKVLSLEVNLEGLEISERIKEIGVRKIARSMILNLILTYSEQKRGLSYSEQRIFAKLGDKFDEAEKNDLGIVELEDAWFDLIKTSMKEAKMQPDRLFDRVFNLIEEAERKDD